MTEVPTAPPVAEAVSGTVVPSDRGVVFPVGRLVMLGLIGMVGALALLLFQAMHERDEYRKAYLDVAPGNREPKQSPNGKFDGSVTPPKAESTPEETPVSSPESPTSEV